MGIKEQDFEEGKVVVFGEREWDVLAKMPGSSSDYLCITHDIVCEKAFDEDGNNNWTKSSLRKWLNEEFVKELNDVVLENAEQDLTTDDGLCDYRATTDKVFLLTQGQYRTYRDKMNDVEDWWWLITAHSTKTNYVRRVNTDGTLNSNYASSGGYGVRPACVVNLESSKKLQEETETGEKAIHKVEITLEYDPKQLENMIAEEAREKFLKNCECIDREGKEKLLETLECEGFFEQPASTKYHGAYKGGLATHSNNVYERLKWLCEHEKMRYSEETIAVVALFHDVCKADKYIRNEDGNYKYANDEFPVGHGEKSVICILRHMELTSEEIMAIRWHMGAYDTSQTGKYDLDKAQKKSKLVTLLHIADMLASRLDD